MVDGDDKQEYSAGQLEIGQLYAEDIVQYRIAGERKDQEDNSAHNDSGVEGFLAPAFGYVVGDFDKYRDVADRIDYRKQS